LIKEAIDRVLSLAAIQVLEIGGRKYTDKGIVPVKEPLPAALKIETLTGLMDFLKANTDKIDFEKVLLQVEGHDKVSFISALQGDFVQRAYYLTANNPGVATGIFDRFIDTETFVIYLQTRFVQDDETARVLSVVGNIKDEVVKNTADDGTTQNVTVKAGITRVGEVAVPNPVILRPFRTFPEIEQPASKFVLRMKSGSPPSCALFEADGGAWKLTAIQSIRNWIGEELKKATLNIPIIA